MADGLTEQLAAVAAGGDDVLPGDVALMGHRADSTVVRSGGVVAKAHPVDADPVWLTARVRIAAHPLLRRVLLAPLRAPGSDGLVGYLPHGRLVTRWPYGSPVPPDEPDAAPWVELGALLARLHAVPVAELPGPLPPMGGPRKAASALSRMRYELALPGESALTDAAVVVERAWRRLPAWARYETAPPQARVLCHGDLHLGQLVRHPIPDGSWHLIDVDELGLGPPAWDLARPAAWYATGLLVSADWHRFLDAYRGAGGCAVPAVGRDAWSRLDVPARALTIQMAALAVAKAHSERRPLDEVEQAVVDTCDRIAELPPEKGI